MSEQQQTDGGQVPNVSQDAVTGIDHQPVQGAESGTDAAPETVDHPTSGNPDASPAEQQQAAGGDNASSGGDAEGTDASQTPSDGAQGDAGSPAASGTHAADTGAEGSSQGSGDLGGE